jgi:hypothetical protein
MKPLEDGHGRRIEDLRLAARTTAIEVHTSGEA